MDYCAERGIPYSEFAGWSQADRDRAVVWKMEQLVRCPSCHLNPEEHSYVDNGGRRRSLLVAEPDRCPHCAERERVSDQYSQARASLATPMGAAPNDPGVRIRLFWPKDENEGG